MKTAWIVIVCIILSTIPILKTLSAPEALDRVSNKVGEKELFCVFDESLCEKTKYPKDVCILDDLAKSSCMRDMFNSKFEDDLKEELLNKI